MRFWKVKVSHTELLVTVDFHLQERIKRNRLLSKVLDVVMSLLGSLARPRPSNVDATAAPSTLPVGHAGERGDLPIRAEILERTAGIEWYHCIDLGHDVVTPGAFDHRSQLHHYHLPQRLDGLRVLDVATKDGFFAFEFERRGASEVVALDIETYAELDWPAAIRRELPPERLDERMGAGFEVAHSILESNVVRHSGNVYDLSTEQLGKFDLVFSGSLLLHLMNPAKALENICSVTRGYALIVDLFDPRLPNQFMFYGGGEIDLMWWYFSIESLEKMIYGAGFRQVRLLDKFPLVSRKGSIWHATFEARV